MRLIGRLPGLGGLKDRRLVFAKDDKPAVEGGGVIPSRPRHDAHVATDQRRDDLRNQFLSSVPVIAELLRSHSQGWLPSTFVLRVDSWVGVAESRSASLKATHGGGWMCSASGT